MGSVDKWWINLPHGIAPLPPYEGVIMTYPPSALSK